MSHFEWSAPTGTSLHRHLGWELVLVRTGRLWATVDGRNQQAGQGQFVDLPAASVHAIWAVAPVTFDVVGELGLGLWMVVPDTHMGRREVPVYDRDGPWRQDPPPGASYTTEAEADALRKLSQTLYQREMRSA